jgi:hypothetical protein
MCQLFFTGRDDFRGQQKTLLCIQISIYLNNDGTAEAGSMDGFVSEGFGGRFVLEIMASSDVLPASWNF